MKKSLPFILGLLVLFILSSCGGKSGTAGASSGEKQRFIEATLEVTCLVMQSRDLKSDLSTENRPEINQKVEAIFKKHKFDVEDSEEMKNISAKYENDEEVVEKIQKGIKNCAKI